MTPLEQQWKRIKEDMDRHPEQIGFKGLCDCGHPKLEHSGKSHDGRCTVYTDHHCPCPSYESSWVAYEKVEE